jgi:hypothetical protein
MPMTGWRARVVRSVRTVGTQQPHRLRKVGAALWCRDHDRGTANYHGPGLGERSASPVRPVPCRGSSTQVCSSRCTWRSDGGVGRGRQRAATLLTTLTGTRANGKVTFGVAGAIGMRHHARSMAVTETGMVITTAAVDTFGPSWVKSSCWSWRVRWPAACGSSCCATGSSVRHPVPVRSPRPPTCCPHPVCAADNVAVRLCNACRSSPLIAARDHPRSGLGSGAMGEQ